LRVAFYSDTYLPAVDGVVTSMLAFKKELERRGNKVYIFASGTLQNKKKYESKDVFIYTGIKFRPYPQYSAAIFPYHSILKLDDYGIDLIHAQTPFTMGFNGLLAAKLAKYPIVGSFHTLFNYSLLTTYYPKNIRKTKKYLWKYIKFFYRRCDRVIAPSNTVAHILRKYKINNVDVVPNGIDTKVFNERANPEKAISNFELRKDKKIVLYMGRISKEKSIDIFIKAAAHLAKKRDDIYFVLGGTGPLLTHYIKMARRVGLNKEQISFLGFIDQHLMPSLYAASDALCLPSAFETQGIVCLEAMATGKPVVAADTPVLKEFVKSGYNGETFEKGSYLDCARKIEKVLNNSSAYKKGAISTAKEFSIERATNKLLDVYKKTINE